MLFFLLLDLLCDIILCVFFFLLIILINKERGRNREREKDFNKFMMMTMLNEEYFMNIINLLKEYNWIYDFQVIDIFNNDTLENKFPIEVRKCLLFFVLLI